MKAGILHQGMWIKLLVGIYVSLLIGIVLEFYFRMRKSMLSLKALL